MLIDDRFQALSTIILEICKLSGTPGLSLGVLHRGRTVHQANFGFRDVAAQLPVNENTTFVIGSLTKALTAAIAGTLVDERKLSWTTQLHGALPDYRRPDPALNVTLEDLLSHRSGLPSYNAFWLSSDNRIPIPRTQALPLLSYVPTAAPLRTAFIYNNMAYDAVGQMLEKASGGIKYSQLLKDRILDPLGMDATVYTDAPIDERTASKSYAALTDATPVEIPRPFVGEDVFLGPAGGVRSSVRDLLVLYRAFLEAANSQIDHVDAGCGCPLTVANNPLRQLRSLWRNMVSLPDHTLREYSYALGWVRAELPGTLAFVGQDAGGVPLPPVGMNLPCRLVVIHEGNIPGSTAYAALFPETSSAVVVLANSVGLTNTVRLVGQLLVETLYNNTSIDLNEYLEYARITSRAGAGFVSEVRDLLESSRTVERPTRPLKAYTGRYWNSIGNYFIDISEPQVGILYVSFLGLEENTFSLEAYQVDSFFWLTVDHNELARRARYTTFGMEYYVLEFGCDSEGGMLCLVWKHEATISGRGETFRKAVIDNGRMHLDAVQHVLQAPGT